MNLSLSLDCYHSLASGIQWKWCLWLLRLGLRNISVCFRPLRRLTLRILLKSSLLEFSSHAVSWSHMERLQPVALAELPGQGQQQQWSAMLEPSWVQPSQTSVQYSCSQSDCRPMKESKKELPDWAIRSMNLWEIMFLKSLSQFPEVALTNYYKLSGFFSFYSQFL